MKRDSLKKIRDNMPEIIKILFHSPIRNQLIKNKIFLSTYQTLMERDTLTESKIKEIQLYKLKEILICAYDNVPYYQELFKKISFDPHEFSDFKDMSQIPFLTRDLVRDNFDRLQNDKKSKGNGNYIATTGGSTGEPLKVLLDYDSIYMENAFIYYYRRSLGYDFKDKLATFRGIEFNGKLWRLNPMYNELVFSPFSLSKVTLNRYINKINDYCPQYLNGYLSSLYSFAKLLSDNRISLSFKLKGLFLISENIDNERREYVERFFNSKSLTFYGHSERCIIAEEKRKNMYLFDPFYGFTEQVPIGNGLYSIVGTGFLNRTMPLIRYKTDDICSPCENLFSLEGRWNGTNGLYGKNNEYVAHSAFNFHSDIFKNITNYQFVQNEKGKADILIIVNKDFESNEVQLMRKEIDKKTKGIIEFNIKVVDKLILSPRGKFKMFISNIVNE